MFTNKFVLVRSKIIFFSFFFFFFFQPNKVNWKEYFCQVEQRGNKLHHVVTYRDS